MTEPTNAIKTKIISTLLSFMSWLPSIVHEAPHDKLRFVVQNFEQISEENPTKSDVEFSYGNLMASILNSVVTRHRSLLFPMFQEN